MDQTLNYWAIRARQRVRRRQLLAAGSSAAALFAAGCASRGGAPTGKPAGGPGDQSSPRSGGAIAVAQTSNIPTLDPQRTTSFYTLLPSSPVYSRPFKFKNGPDPKVAAAHDVEPDLALSAESPDALTWTIKLRSDAKFHNLAPVNGRAVEAEDIKASFTRAVDPANPNRTGLNMIDPDQIQTPAKDTVVFKLNFPYAPFQATLASPQYAWITPREAAAGAYDPAKIMIGSGPFIFDTYTPDVAVTYKRNPDWFSKPLAYADSLRWAIVPDASQQRAQFVGGNLDFLGTGGSITISPFDVDQLRKDVPAGRLVKADPNQGQIMFFQYNDPSSASQDIRLRQAFSLGIDRAALSKTLYNNDAVPQLYAPASFGRWALLPADLPAETAQFYKYDPAQAKKLAEASGFANTEFKLVYMTQFLGPAYEQAAQTSANMLSQAGLKVSAVAVDYTKDYIGGGKGIRYGNYDKNTLVFTGLSNFTDIDEYLFGYFNSKGPLNMSHVNDPSLDAMIAKARTVVNTDERRNAYLDVQKFIASKVYSISGMSVTNAYSMSGPRIANYCPGVSYGLGTETYAKAWVKA